MKRIHLLRGILASLLVVSALRCGSETSTTHILFMAAAEWSPVNNSLLAITKDEFDQRTIGGGCGDDPDFVAPRAESYDIFLADTSGTILKRVTQGLNLAHDAHLRFSPQGTRLLVWGSSDPRLWIVDTSGAVFVSDSIGYPKDADWAPNGQKIVVSSLIPTSGVPRLSTINADGSGFTLLSRTLHTGSVAWSGQNLIAFIYIENQISYLAVVNPDGSGLRTLDSSAVLYNVRWSPEGRLILYVEDDGTASTVLRLDVPSGQREALVQFVDGSSILSARYSPDGSMVSYYTYKDPNQFFLYVTSADGSGGNQLVASLSTDGSWSPDSRSLAYIYYNAVKTALVK